MKKQPKSKRNELLEALEAWTKFYVKAKVNGRCFYAGKDGVQCSGAPSWGHIIAQARSKRLKHDPQNLECECQGHNFHHKHNEGDFHVFWLRRDPERLEYLKANQHKEWKPTIDELEERVYDLFVACDIAGLITQANIDRFHLKKKHLEIIKQINRGVC